MQAPTRRNVLRPRLLLACLALGLAALPTSGCTGMLHSATGSTMSSYAQQHMVPYLLGQEDVDVACQTGAAMGAFVASFERVTDRPDLPVLVSMLGAGMCSESQAWEADLRYARAVRAGASAEARDAQILSERLHTLAALRFGAAWTRTTQAFGDLTGPCPQVQEDEQIFLLLGLASGLQAVMHDRSARGAANISLSIPQTVARASQCLDSKKWWGVPKALAAAVYLTVPGAQPEGVDAAVDLELAGLQGDTAKVRLSRGLQVVTYATIGAEASLVPALQSHAKALAADPPASQWKMLDAYGEQMSRHVADLIWTRAVGFRSSGDLSDLPGQATATDGAGDDGVLDNLEEPASAPAPTATPAPAAAPAKGRPGKKK
ncbi:MAG: hypothetical protein ACOYOB_11255 [Myxococcota bacterium]